MLRSQPDERLVALTREGREPAFEEIVRRYRPGLVAFAAAYAPRDRAEDVVQESLVRSWEAIRASDAEIRLRPWLYTIVRNRALNARRDARLHEPLDEAIDGVRQPMEILLSREELARVVAAVSALPPAQRRALVRSALEGHTHEQIASELDTSPGAVRQLIFRARSALREGATLLLPLPLVRALVETAPGRAEAACAGGGAAAAGLASAGGGSLAAKAATVAAVGAAVAGSGLAIEGAVDPGGKSDERARAASSAPRGAAGDDAGRAPDSGVEGFGEFALPGDGLGSDASGPSADEDDSDRSGSDRDEDRSGPGAGDSQEPTDSSGPGSGELEDTDEDDDGGSGPSLNSGPGSDSSGSGSSGSGTSGSGSDSSGSGSSGSGTSGSDSSGSGSSGSGTSGSDSSGSGSGPSEPIMDPLELEPDSSGSGSGSRSGLSSD